MALDDDRESASREIGAGYKYLATGLRFAGGIVLFIVGGLFLDRWLGTSPLFILVGTVVGSGLSFLSVYRELVADKKNRPTWRKRQGSGGRRQKGTRQEAEGKRGEEEEQQ